MLMLEGSDALTIAVAREGLPKLDRYGGPKAWWWGATAGTKDSSGTTHLRLPSDLGPSWTSMAYRRYSAATAA
jgi:hypothetical protein